MRNVRWQQNYAGSYDVRYERRFLSYCSNRIEFHWVYLITASDSNEPHRAYRIGCTACGSMRSVTLTLTLTHSLLTAALDQLRVVASSTSNDPGSRSRQHQLIGQCLLPSAAATLTLTIIYIFLPLRVKDLRYYNLLQGRA